MPTKKTTTKESNATIQDIVDAVYDLSSKLDRLTPLAELAAHLNEFIEDPKHTKTPGIPICIQDVGEYVLGRTFDRAITITTKEPIEIKTPKPIRIATTDDDCWDDD